MMKCAFLALALSLIVAGCEDKAAILAAQEKEAEEEKIRIAQEEENAKEAERQRIAQEEAERIERLHAAVRDAVRESLKDPDSAMFRNQVDGCGEVNAKNSFGGYVGYRRFYTMPFRSEKGDFVVRLIGIETADPKKNEAGLFDEWFDKCHDDQKKILLKSKEIATQ